MKKSFFKTFAIQLGNISIININEIKPWIIQHRDKQSERVCFNWRLIWSFSIEPSISSIGIRASINAVSSGFMRANTSLSSSYWNKFMSKTFKLTIESLSTHGKFTRTSAFFPPHSYMSTSFNFDEHTMTSSSLTSDTLTAMMQKPCLNIYTAWNDKNIWH